MLSVSVAQALSTIIISADSRQFYKEMQIGTAKPNVEEMGGIKHYFIDSHSIQEEINVSQFVQEANQILDEEFKVHNEIILTGGSGMFIDALCFGLDDIPHSPELQQELNLHVAQNGTATLLQEIKDKDPEYFSQLDHQNPIRIIRAVEVLRLTNKKYSELRTNTKKESKYEVSYFVISHPRDILYERLNNRVDKMLELGLENEVRKLIEFTHLKPMKTVGYTEWDAYFETKINYSDCIELIKQNTRRYAKRQITWFKRNKSAIWLNYSSIKEMTEEIITHSK